MEPCIACDLLAGRHSLPGGVIHRSTSWVVEHCIGPLGVGTLIVKPARHVVGVDELTDQEAAELGPLLRDASRVVRALTGAEQVYNCLWSHAGGRPGHVHYVVQPVTAGQVAERNASGPALQMAMFLENQTPEVGEVEAFAERARTMFEPASDEQSMVPTGLVATTTPVGSGGVVEPGALPLAGAELSRAGAGDAPEVLVLQRCCWVAEAIANQTLAIPALHEDLEAVQKWIATRRVWIVRRAGRLVAAVRAHLEGDRWEIGRLMVAPDLGGQGLGRWLLLWAECHAPQEAVAVDLYTGSSSHRNLTMYRRAGFTVAEPPAAGAGQHIQGAVYLTKPSAR